MDNTVSVSQLNLYVKSLLEGDTKLLNISVTGEISNFKDHYSSGHWYFSLKDGGAAIRCVMFRFSAAKVKFLPEDGMKVIIRGRVSLYEKDGQYQFYAEDMIPDGMGEILLQFEQIKSRLAAEGLFNPETKREIPKFAKKIAVVTSPTGAALQDILNIISRRWPLAEIILCSVSVQGELAVGEMLVALDKLYKANIADLIIIGRGGGSIEDLWAFNNENLARKIYESPVPVISAVGHETDFTICDFVSDLRAPTPSAAAELAVPDIREVSLYIEDLASALKTYLSEAFQRAKNKLSTLENSYAFKNPRDILIYRRFLEFDKLSATLLSDFEKSVTAKENEFTTLVSRLDALSPLKVLLRGYSVAEKDDMVLNSVKDLSIGDSISLKLSDGKAECLVKNIIGA